MKVDGEQSGSGGAGAGGVNPPAERLAAPDDLVPRGAIGQGLDSQAEGFCLFAQGMPAAQQLLTFYTIGISLRTCGAG